MLLVNFVIFYHLWITLCVTRYKQGFCWGMQQTVRKSKINTCLLKSTPYNAPPLTRNNALTRGPAGKKRTAYKKLLLDSKGLET
ncbi:hypothetical protein B9086_001010 [Morganella morganii subsp. morganii]|nr:hypothetical protein CP987_17505 [Morganella morganii]PHH10188.1 hypothetical protein CRX48_17505 [Morganella morganii]QCY22711.1 hypothetical protein EO986_17500 [Morganella morganii subsp. morganii]RNW16253.1 hypothetical protein B9086_001010 [Morganella morganii subsp. morganii]